MFGFIKKVGGIRKAGHVLGKLPYLAGISGFSPEGLSTPLQEVPGLKDNPGNLRMFTYAPAGLAPDHPLVVVLHGCKQTAAGYDLGAGWSTLADRYGFALLFPQQQAANNPNGCFNWFDPGDTQRGRGEVASIRHMIEKIANEERIDRRRIFITGLSAGGAMTSAMLACYPEVFGAGAIIAGLPYGAAQNVQQAFESMFQCPLRSGREWGELVRAAAPQHKGPWPRVSIWHGNADATVIPANAGEIIKQWADVHGLKSTPSFQQRVDGYPRDVWVDQAGREVIEAYKIMDMAHGTPLATGKSDYQCGEIGPFFLETGISSSYHIAKFFGVTAGGVRTLESATREATATTERQSSREPAALYEARTASAETSAATPKQPPPGFDVGAVITNALKAAGLIKPHH
jgi:poly(hydroxyalkanoate) depolymerase family esterase